MSAPPLPVKTSAAASPAQDAGRSVETARGVFTLRPETPTAVRDGEPIGRVIENDERDVVYFIDFALLPQWHGQGMGTALLGALIARWAERGRSARAKVLVTNEPSLQMCRKLGFVAVGEPVQGHIDLRLGSAQRP